MAEIAFDELRYWLISIDLLEKASFEKYDNLHFQSLRSKNKTRLIFYHHDGNPNAAIRIPRLDRKNKLEGFPHLYLYVDDALGHRIVVTIGEINSHLAGIISEKADNSFKMFHKSLLWETYDSYFFGDDVQSIFKKEIYPDWDMAIVELPLILYCEPRSKQLKLTDREISPEKIKSLCKKTESLEGWHLRVGPYVLMSPIQFPLMEKGAALFNSISLNENDQDLCLPYFLRLLIRQIALNNLTVYRLKQILNGDLANFNSSVFHNLSLKNMAKLHKQLMKAIDDFNTIHIVIINEITEFREIDEHFRDYIKSFGDFHTSKDFRIGWTLDEIVVKEVSFHIELLHNQIRRLDNIAGILSNYSRGMLDVQSALRNLSFQKSLIILTFVIFLLTLVLAIESPILHSIVNFVKSMFGISI